ncbi:uncharacterized protein LOC144106164 [Amblyomma americanum]
MKMSQSDLGSIEKEIQCLDCTRIASKVKSLSAAFSDCGVDLNTPCGSTENRTTCWIAWHLPDLNKVLCTVSVQVVEHTPGAFTMNCVSSDDTDYDSFYLESAILVYWLLRCHRCIKRLELAGTVVFLTNFPMLFCKALRVNKGLEQVLIDTTQMWDVWHGMHVSSVLASTLASMSVRLKSLDIQNLMASSTAVQKVASTIRRGAVDRLVARNSMSKRATSKLLRAVGDSSCMNVLEMQGSLILPSTAALLATALKGNTTLRKLSVCYLGADVVGIILTSLKHNTTLEELSLLYAHDISGNTMWDGLQALRTNTSLKRLKLVQTIFTSSCAIVIADILHENTALEELYLSDNPISNLGAQALAKALHENVSLKRLDVSNCRLTEDILSTFAESLARNNTVECVRLGNIDVSEEWSPSFALTQSVFTRLDVSWNTRGLEQWAACIPQDDQSCFRVGWTDDADPSSVAKWFYSALVSCALLTELVISCPETLAPECAKAFVSLLETTNSLKKFTLGTVNRRYNAVTEIICGLARNKTVREAEFRQNLHTDQDIKAVQQLLRTNRTLHRLKFKSYNLGEKAIGSLAQGLENNFVFLSLDFEYSPALKTFPIMCALNRNQSLLNRAVECVLNLCVDVESMQALRLLSTCDSLLDAVAGVSGKTQEECKQLVQEAEYRLSGSV